MKRIGKVDIPQEAFLAVLKVGEENALPQAFPQLRTTIVAAIIRLTGLIPRRRLTRIGWSFLGTPCAPYRSGRCVVSG
jgi:hypothetical protein